MTTTVPPAYSKVATSDVEVATVEDLWQWSGLLGVPSCTVLAAMQKFVGLDAESVCDCDESR